MFYQFYNNFIKINRYIVLWMNIYQQIKAKSYMFDRVLNTPLKLDVRREIKSLLKALLD